jgi:hypothetical protein
MTKQRRDEAPSTYQAFAGLDDPLPGGRFAAIEPRAVTGSAPTYQVPCQPTDSPWARDPVPDEEPLGIDVSAPVDIGEPSPPQPRPLPGVAEGGERGSRAPAPTVERGNPANLKRRRRMP